MKSAIFVTQDRLDLDHLSHDFKSYGLVNKSEDRLVVEGPNGWFALSINDSILDDYDESELQLLRRSFSDFFLAQLEFSTIEAANFAINHMVIPCDSLVDNNHGNITNIESIQKLIQSHIDWTTLRSSYEYE